MNKEDVKVKTTITRSMTAMTFYEGVKDPDKYDLKDLADCRANKILELCSNGFEGGKCMCVTLIFDPSLSPDKDFCDLDTAHKEFEKFIKKVNDRYDDFRYVAIFFKFEEYNCWKYGLICNFSSDVSEEKIGSLWKNGVAKKVDIPTEYDMGEAVTLFMGITKANTNILKKGKWYFASDNIEPSIVYHSWIPEEIDDVASIVFNIEKYGIKPNGIVRYTKGSSYQFWVRCNGIFESLPTATKKKKSGNKKKKRRR